MEDQIKIRNYKYSELLEITSLTSIAYSVPYKTGGIINKFHETIEELKKDIKRGSEILVAQENKKIIGAVRFAIINSKLKFGRLAVLPDYRKRGIGEKLIKAIINIAQKRNIDVMVLDVMEEKGLIPFYEKFGFKTKSKKKHQNHHDVIMEKRIKSHNKRT